jgi:hypothetical protein
MGIFFDKPFKQELEKLQPSKNRFVIQFLSADDVPQQGDFFSQIDPLIRSRIESENKIVLSREVQTLVQIANGHPVWNSYHDFSLVPPKDSMLRVEIFESESLIGFTNIKVSDLCDEYPKRFKCTHNKFETISQFPNFSVSLRRVFVNSAPPLVKTFFIVRHGESVWNRAKKDMNLLHMFDNDHGLTSDGVTQSITLNSKYKSKAIAIDNMRCSQCFSDPFEVLQYSSLDRKLHYEEKFVQSTAVFVSPLTR